MADDAAVYRISDTQALIQTVDFFTPIVDDPRAYGAIAAANALSDIYAMGGEVLLALNIGAFPADLPPAMVSEILLGAAEVVRSAGGVVAGGHTVTDDEPKFGLVVTGTVHPDHVITLAGAQAGDVLILTKPLGTGIIATAARADGLTDPRHLDEAVYWMTTLNRVAARAMQSVGVHACTDITGFGLLGHAAEMAEASHVRLHISAATLPIMEGTLDYAAAGYTTGGAGRNQAYFENVTLDAAIPAPLRAVAYDPQTSGGLLISVAADKQNALLQALTAEGAIASVIGTVSSGAGVTLTP